MLVRLLYTIVGYLALPFLVIFLNLPKKHKPAYGKRFIELMGFVNYQSNNPNRIWIHTVSVGETIAAIPLIKKYHELHPDIELIVTTTTTTGAAQLKKLDFVTHFFAPLDYPHAIYLFLKRVQPKALIIMETELWPNWLNACKKRKIPTILMNARLSERSCNKYQKLFSIFTELLGSKLSLVLCQNKYDEERYHRLKVTNTAITGSMKYDLEINQTLLQKGNELKQAMGDRPIWIAASTHEGEDEIFLSIHHKVLEKIPHALLILVPRHPERFDSVAKKIEKENLTYVRRSQNKAISTQTQVYLGDTLGELILLFQASDLVFMGGSLVDIGGHNPIEPAALAKPLLIGSFYYNFEDIVVKLKDVNGIEILSDPNQIAEHLISWFEHPNISKQIGQNAYSFIEANHGAIDQTIKHIDELLKL